MIDYTNTKSLKKWTAPQSRHIGASYFKARKLVKVFGTFAAPYDLADLEEVPSEGVYGLSVFAKRFLRSLFRHSDFDEFHFFCSSSYREPRADELLGSDKRVRLFPLREFSASAREFDYHVLHNIWTPDIGPWTDMRNRLCPAGIPVTGLTHTISYQSFLPRVLSTMVMGARPRSCPAGA